MKKLLLTTTGIILYVAYILAPFLIVYTSEPISGGTITLKQSHPIVYQPPYNELVNNKNKRRIVFK